MQKQDLLTSNISSLKKDQLCVPNAFIYESSFSAKDKKSSTFFVLIERKDVNLRAIFMNDRKLCMPSQNLTGYKFGGPELILIYQICTALGSYRSSFNRLK